jgi:metal-responsive CopG/Arc/MetJ family transcriptional regulator
MTKIELSLPDDLVTHLDDVRSKLDYKSRDEFTLAALKRLLDRYKILLATISA